MPKTWFCKRPVVIEAWQLTQFADPALWEWCGGRIEYDATGRPVALNIQTLEGTMRAQKGDWIIRGVKGEFYPCKPDVFAETYDQVHDDPPVKSVEPVEAVAPKSLSLRNYFAGQALSGLASKLEEAVAAIIHGPDPSQDRIEDTCKRFAMMIYTVADEMAKRGS